MLIKISIVQKKEEKTHQGSRRDASRPHSFSTTHLSTSHLACVDSCVGRGNVTVVVVELWWYWCWCRVVVVVVESMLMHVVKQCLVDVCISTKSRDHIK